MFAKFSLKKSLFITFIMKKYSNSFIFKEYKLKDYKSLNLKAYIFMYVA